jgi:condensin complex subunit 1
VERVFPAILQLLFSKVTSDVLEAVEFFVTAHHCGLAEAEAGIRRMLPLVWSKEGDVANAVVEAYRKIFLSTDGAAGKSKYVRLNLTFCFRAKVKVRIRVNNYSEILY